MYFIVWLGGHVECWPVTHGIMLLRPCPLIFLACQANDDDDDNKEEEENEKGTLGSASYDKDFCNKGIK